MDEVWIVGELLGKDIGRHGLWGVLGQGPHEGRISLTTASGFVRLWGVKSGHSWGIGPVSVAPMLSPISDISLPNRGAAVPNSSAALACAGFLKLKAEGGRSGSCRQTSDIRHWPRRTCG